MKTPFLAFISGAVLSGVATLLLTTYRGPEPSGAIAAGTPASPDFAVELAAIAAKLDQLEHALQVLRSERVIPANRSSVAPVTATDASVSAPPPTRATDSTLDAILAAGAPASELMQRAPLRGTQWLMVKAGHLLDEAQEFDAGGCQELLTQEHLCWSVREVLACYGRPHAVLTFGGNNGLGLHYEWAQPARSFYFRIQEGIVIEVNCHDF